MNFMANNSLANNSKRIIIIIVFFFVFVFFFFFFFFFFFCVCVYVCVYLSGKINTQPIKMQVLLAICI